VVCIAWNFDVISVNVQTGHERGLTYPTSDTTSQTNRGAYTATRGCRFQMEPVYVYRVWWAVCRTDEIQGEVSSLQCTEIEIWRIPVACKLVWYLEDVLQEDPKERDTTSQNNRGEYAATRGCRFQVEPASKRVTQLHVPVSSGACVKARNPTARTVK